MTNLRNSILKRLRGSKRKKGGGINNQYIRDALSLAKFVDCSKTDLEQKQQNFERVASNVSDRVCHWYLPPFENPNYGGIMTILRLAAFLKKEYRIQSRIFICGKCDAIEVAKKISQAMPVLTGIEVVSLDTVLAIARIPPSDYSVATLWTTAYVVLKLNNTGLKFYMIQDFEPLFYPAGSTFAQAELTYRFGFFGIANTQSLNNIYKERFNGKAVTLNPSVDSKIFYQGTNLPRDEQKKLFYYARPGVPRNCFELAIAALRIVKERMGDRVRIICAGQNWNPDEFELDGIVETIGMLPYDKTGDLYRSCHVALSMMMTPHPSYLPFEMMGCGTLVVANRNSANTWILKDRINCLISEPTASCLSETLIDSLTNYESYADIRQNAADFIRENHGDWYGSLKLVADFMINLHLNEEERDCTDASNS